MGSIEYGVAELGVPLIVVLGHEECGAVQAAVSVVKENATFPGSIGKMIEPIVPAVLKAQSQPGDLLDNAVRENVRRTVHRLRTSEALLLGPIKTGKLKVVGARYDLDDGQVEFATKPERGPAFCSGRRSARPEHRLQVQNGSLSFQAHQRSPAESRNVLVGECTGGSTRSALTRPKQLDGAERPLSGRAARDAG
ncbi:hypothetical protein OCOJLMKI_4959 [Methylobacterium iners]|uniref:Carbonic anhydrase n=3 Tax=Methylobacterium iners TaxID=418707 RepID=A0ABQ4S492_9HYPH|nr:hypothetical protein OCOJLMKI_4959 [Methylobacterium iners]